MAAPKTIVFAGTPEFAVPSLKALIEDSGFEVTLVVTQPDKPVGRKQALTAPPIKDLAQEHGIKIWQPANFNQEFSDMPAEAPDFLVVVAYGQILSQEVLDWPKVAPVNVHGSLLPHLRGAAPLQHTILGGDTAAGVTVQRMAAELDSGPILAQQELLLEETATFAELHDTLSEMGVELLIKTLKEPLNETPQDESKVTVCSKLSRADGVIDPAKETAEEIDRKVRALVPWPGVTWGENKLIKTSLAPTPDSYGLKCKDETSLYIETIQPAGGKPMSGSAFGRGH